MEAQLDTLPLKKRLIAILESLSGVEGCKEGSFVVDCAAHVDGYVVFGIIR